MLFSQRVFQNTSLPLKKARLTPASRAASTFVRCWPDQYSSWPDRHEDLVVEQQVRRCGRCRCLGDVADVVAVALEAPDHRVLGVEDRSSRRRAVASVRRERPVVADLVGGLVASGLPEGRPPCSSRGCCRRSCCRPARWCRRSGTTIAEWLASLRTTKRIWLSRAGVVIADQVRDVDAGDRRRRAPPTKPRPPSCRSRPGRCVLVVSVDRPAGSGAASPRAASSTRSAGAVAAVVAEP